MRQVQQESFMVEPVTFEDLSLQQGKNHDWKLCGTQAIAAIGLRGPDTRPSIDNSDEDLIGVRGAA